ncbi:MAG TPA: hypothetical protein VEI97_04260 [bacterium]|nr:hypothetical protein [bacterium]
MSAAEAPWLPAPLRAHGFTIETVALLRYVVVDEMVGEDVGLALWPWPVADGLGRLRFRNVDERYELGMPAQDLQRELYAGWRSRPPRIGDVFAARADGDALAELRAGTGVWTRPFAALFPGPVYDITLEARHLAKLAYYASVTPVMRGGEPGRWDLPRPERPVRAAPVRKAGAEPVRKGRAKKPRGR